jgi:hypothetical protein
VGEREGVGRRFEKLKDTRRCWARLTSSVSMEVVSGGGPGRWGQDGVM